MFPVLERVLKTDRHTTFHLSCGAEGAPLLVFVHGWPELSISWRHQLPCFASLGFRAVAPDMRGYGRSSVYARHEDYALEHSVADMIELLDALGRDKAVWVGHDWGSPVVWSLASHHPERCFGVANLCVPYLSRGFAPENLLPLVDRSVYPEALYPAGQWEYQLFYEESFEAARTTFEANVANTVKALFRKGTAKGKGKPSRTALVRRDGGWFGGAGQAPDLAMDPGVLTPEDFHKYVAALTRTGFFGPDSWYMNHRRNLEFAGTSVEGGVLRMPVLFLHGEYDFTCETVTSRLAEPMRRDCRNLTEAIVPSGHWMAQEQPAAVNAALARWLALQLPELWPRQEAGSAVDLSRSRCSHGPMAAIGWTDGEMQRVLAALDAGGVPELPPDIAATIRAARPISSEAGPAWVFDLDYDRGQQLKQWCDARRAQATEQEPNDVWTRIVARVNEAVQPFAPATEPGHSPVRRAPPA